MAELPKYVYWRLRLAKNGVSWEIDDSYDGDVAEVIKCKDCKWSDEFFHCDRVAWWNTADDFCSRGERKDE